jgi:hypothetical protein
VRKRLRGLVGLTEKSKRKLVYTDFEDELGEGAPIELPAFSGAGDFERFRTKVRQFLKAHENHIAIHKLRLNQPPLSAACQGPRHAPNGFKATLPREIPSKPLKNLMHTHQDKAIPPNNVESWTPDGWCAALIRVTSPAPGQQDAPMDEQLSYWVGFLWKPATPRLPFAWPDKYFITRTPLAHLAGDLKHAPVYLLKDDEYEGAPLLSIPLIRANLAPWLYQAIELRRHQLRRAQRNRIWEMYGESPGNDFIAGVRRWVAEALETSAGQLDIGDYGG